MLLPKKLFSDKKAMTAFIEYKKFSFFRGFLIWSFVFLNAFVIIIHLKFVGGLFIPDFLSAARVAWMGVWGAVFISRIVDHLIKRTDQR